MSDYVICAREVRGKTFSSEPAPSSYLVVPDDGQPRPSKEQLLDSKKWALKVMAEARKGVPAGGEGHILVFIHGYNNDQKIIMARHRRLRDDLRAANFPGVVVSFDWPSGDVGAFYLEDLEDAHKSAYQLVGDGIVLLASLQQPDCKINIHLLAHSMGAYVTREAFTAADDVEDLTGKAWHVSQIMLIAPDVSCRSMGFDDHRSNGIYRCCTRLTCYSSKHDDVLKLSNVKRAGVAERAGRAGLPPDAPDHAVNVDCSDYWTSIPKPQAVIGDRKHSWHIGDSVFTRDMIETMNGVSRGAAVTRELQAPNRYRLIRPA
jgi:pimeloyl-ACP methyl ester carboxylesterase